MIYHLVLPRKRPLIPGLAPLTSADWAPILRFFIAEAIVTRHMVTLQFCRSTKGLAGASW